MRLAMCLQTVFFFVCSFPTFVEHQCFICFFSSLSMFKFEVTFTSVDLGYAVMLNKQVSINTSFRNIV